MNLLHESRSLLEKAGYRTLLERSASGVCYFEDATVMGALFVHGSVTALLEEWESSQDRFLRQHSGPLRNDPVKVWNIYTVHLTADVVTGPVWPDPFDIEQDFRGTRKIVQTGVRSKAELRDALLPLLNLQHQVAMSPKEVAQRLQDRMSHSSPVLEQLLCDVNESHVINELLEQR